MGKEEKYMIEMYCDGFEGFDGFCSVNEKRLEEIKQKKRSVSSNGSTCKITVKNTDGEVVLVKEVPS